ncbi:hypothetical protein ACE14D_14255 [Streptomyces sp. Act-28]
MTRTVYTIETAYAHMRRVQERARRSRVREAAVEARRGTSGERRVTTTRAKER